MTLVDRMRWLEAVRETMPEDCTAFLVAFHLQAHDGKKGIYPPIALLAEEVRRDERNVRRALGRLKKAGLLSWSKGFPGKANFYYLKTPKRAPVPGKTGHMHAYAQGASAHPSHKENSGGRGSAAAAPPPKELENPATGEAELRQPDPLPDRRPLTAEERETARRGIALVRAMMEGTEK